MIITEVGYDDRFDAVVIEWLSEPCQITNGHQHCEWPDLCSCTCHILDNNAIGWLMPVMEKQIESLEQAVGPCTRKDDAWWAAATVLAVWVCGTDVVRIQHALGKGPALIERAAANLREQGIWKSDGSWHGLYMEADVPNEEAAVGLACHVMVAEGKLEAKPQGDEFAYRLKPGCSCKEPHG